MAELKTVPTGRSVDAFIDALTPARQEDCRTLVRMMTEVTGAEPKMWGPSIVGFGSYHYRYESGREADWMLIGFSPRKSDLTLYIMPGFSEHAEQLATLGRHRTGKSCLYIKRLADVDLAVLRDLMRESVAAMRKRYAPSESTPRHTP
ncbi:MAG TPA: DUF1801 domain-containing protein [Gemmatimonadaceae bacterium]|nr:DUF1801 domain-containing protein [Gemmatimonadaceae bacterium]